MRGLIDSHCHLDMLPLWRSEAEIDAAAVVHEQSAILERARVAGVEQIVVPGCAWPDLDAVRNLPAHFGNVWVAFGIHPHEASSWTAGSSERLADYLSHPRAVAVGEC
ncbi:MAG: TatD family hydrolase, partial [Cyanobacteria bacterium REEB65]|nr:TatD family hydrolase [Cyanobacteria bacterium REEB65]